MTSLVEVPYSVLVGMENSTPISINSYDFSTASAEIRQHWVEHIIEDLQPGRSGLEAIRACQILLNSNGNADVRLEPTLYDENHHYVYPARFRIPPATIEDLPSGDQARRAEMFAFGSLLYHIYSGHKPFNNLSEELVEAYFANAEFPHDILDLDKWPMILSSWSLEFARDLHNSIASSLRDRLLNYARSHPYLFALQASGGFISAVSFGAPLILGGVGFGALGPVAGSVAVGWQSSIGIVPAGSFFAWCQSAAMGGAAASGIFAAGVAGASTAAGATLAGFLTKADVGNMTEEQIQEMYEKAFRRGPKAEVMIERRTSRTR